MVALLEAASPPVLGRCRFTSRALQRLMASYLVGFAVSVGAPNSADIGLPRWTSLSGR